jgi:hypothetical protein
VNGVCRRQLLGYLESGVAAADDHDGSDGNVARTPVARAVHLGDVRREVRCKRGHVWDLEGTRRNDDLIGLEGPCSDGEDEAEIAGCGCDRMHAAVELDRQLEGRGISLEVINDLVALGVTVGVVREGEAWKAVVATRREEHK